MNEPIDPVLTDLHRHLGSLGPVAPLWTPVRRAQMLTPLVILVTVASPLLLGVRLDLAAYAPVMTWGLTALQTFLGVWLLILGLEEAIPGRNVSTPRLGSTAVLAAALLIAITLLTDSASHTRVPIGREFSWWLECIIGSMVLAAPLLLTATVLAARAFSTRPAVTGALCGLSADLLADAGWRLNCRVSDPTHVIGAHALAVVGTVALGVALACLVDLRRWRKPAY